MKPSNSSLAQLLFMPLDVVVATPRNTFVAPAPPVVLAANTTTDILPDMTNPYDNTLAARRIQNVGANPCFIAYGSDANTSNYNAVVAAGQQLDISDNAQRVSGFSVAGTTFAIEILRKQDMTHSQQIFPSYASPI